MVDKRQLRRTLERERRRIARRLEKAVQPNTGGPLLGRANITYELSERTRAVTHGGIGMIARLGTFCGLATEIDTSLHLLKIHHPYHESDHVLNIAYNALCGGGSLDDIEATAMAGTTATRTALSTIRRATATTITSPST